MKIKVLTAHSACVDTHFSWGEGYQENYYVEHSTMCLIPENTVLTPREAKLILSYCRNEHGRKSPCWQFDSDTSLRLASQLGAQWEGGNFDECTIVAESEAKKVLNEISQKYKSLFPYLNLDVDGYRNVHESAARLNNVIKVFYTNCIRQTPISRIDDGIDYIEINYSFIQAQINKIIDSHYIPAIEQCKQHIELIKKPYIQQIEFEIDYDPHLDANLLEQPSLGSVCKQEIRYSGDNVIRKSVISPLDLAMYFGDLDLVMELLNKGAKNTIFSDLSLEYIETNLEIIKLLYKEDEYFSGLFATHTVRRKILYHYFNEKM